MVERCARNGMSFNKKLDGIATVYDIIAPTSIGIMLTDEAQEELGVSSQKEAVAYAISSIEKANSKVKCINVCQNLVNHNDEYIYFRTDHHWTALGAYYAYEEFCKAKGIKPTPVSDYETMEFPDFLGSFYSSSNQSPALAANPDTVTAYIPKGTNSMTMTYEDGSVVDWPIINDVSGYNRTQLYATFVGGDRPFSVAHNETIHDGSAVMVVKDSFGNAFIPWLVDHYEYIYWVDARYTNNTISQMVADYNVQDVIYEVSIYNASSEKMQGRYATIGQ